VEFEITPEPTDEEREAILAALADDDGEPEPGSAWAEALLPPRVDEP